MALHRARTCFTAPGVPADPELSWPQEEAVLSAGQPLWIAGLLSTCCPHLALFAANLWILLRSRLLCFLVCTLASSWSPGHQFTPVTARGVSRSGHQHQLEAHGGSLLSPYCGPSKATQSSPSGHSQPHRCWTVGAQGCRRERTERWHPSTRSQQSTHPTGTAAARGGSEG